MTEANSRRETEPRPSPADTTGFYNHLGIVLPRSRNNWVPVRCFLDGHQDRHASAAIHAHTGVWKCFACDRKGGPWAAAVARGYSRQEATELAKQYGLWLKKEKAGNPRKTPAATPERQKIDWQELDRQTRAPRDKPLRRREYEYTDEQGTGLFRVVREDFESGKKRIWQERREGDRWKPGLNGTRRVLYRLPEVLERAQAGGLVLLVEGEKVVEALDRIHVFATTSPAGAGKWHDDYTASLAGSLVVACPDMDLAGRRHMTVAAQSLLNHGVRVAGPLELAITDQSGGDLADHLAEAAETIRACTPGITTETLRERLKQHVLRLAAECRPATPEALRAYRERAEHHANPRHDTELQWCKRCQRERPHTIRAGILYCPCGNHWVP